MGHDLTLRVASWECVVQVDGGTPTGVTVTMDLGSLEVVRGEGGLKPLSEGDKRKVLAGAAKTLGDGRATFVTTDVTTDPASDVTPTWTLTGALTLHGVTRPQVVEVTGRGELWTATASVRQTDFGITPYTQAMGALRVGDVVLVRATAQL